MKRLIALIFLVVLVLNVSGTYVFFAIRIGRIYAQRREDLKTPSSSKISRFEFSEAGFQNVRVNKREIKVDGKMYDITQITKSDGRVYVSCIHDEAEDDLFSFLDDVLEQSEKDQRTARAVHFWFTDFYERVLISQHRNFLIIQSNTAYYQMSSEKATQIIAPPPKG